MRIKDIHINKQWSLFLDRDGVINKLVDRLYVYHFDEFEFFPCTLEALKSLAKVFGKIFIVTNQSCVAKGLISAKEVDEIHRLMLDEINNAGGRIDGVYCCPHWVHDDCRCRKPRTGMAEQAKKGFPEVNFKKSVIVGDAARDIEMGDRLGMTTVFIEGNEPESVRKVKSDFCFKDLGEFANEVYQKHRNHKINLSLLKRCGRH